MQNPAAQIDCRGIEPVRHEHDALHRSILKIQGTQSISTAKE
jgi:hypothetical protein